MPTRTGSSGCHWPRSPRPVSSSPPSARPSARRATLRALSQTSASFCSWTTSSTSSTQLLSRLEDRLAVLATKARDAPARHRTLRATIEWSHDLLSEDEQRLFRRLTVFTGGWTLDAAEQVAEADLETLGALVDKSLV